MPKPSNAVRAQSDNTQSRSKIAIEPRHVKFDFQDIESPFYYNGNGFISAMWAALSATFPVGETEFIQSVRLFEGKVSDPKLLADIRNFAAQEAHHSLQHKHVNRFLSEHGYEIKKLDEFFQDKVNSRNEVWSHERRLARTVVCEHVTSVMADYVLNNVRSMRHFPGSLRQILQWHAIEEIEHKSVAFDVYQHCVGDQNLLRKEFRYFSYFEFPRNILLSSRFLLKKIGHKSAWRERKEAWLYLFGRDGLVSSQRSMYMRFMKKDFHPWDHDNSALVDEWKTRLSPHFVNHR